MAFNEYDELVENGAVAGNEYDQMQIDSGAQKTQRVQASMKVASLGPSPDEQAKILELSRKTNLPAGVVGRNYKMVSQQAETMGNDYDRLVKDNPGVAKWLENPENSTLSRDELGNLTAIEGTTKEYNLMRQMLQGLKSGSAGWASSFAKVPAYIADVAAKMPAGNPAIMLDVANIEASMGEKPLPAPDTKWLRNNPVAKYFEDLQTEYGADVPELQESITTLIGAGDYAGAGRAAAVQLAANAPQQVSLLMAGLTGFGAVGLAGAGLTSAAQSYDETMDSVDSGNVKINPDMALLNATLKGSFEAGFESLGTLGVLKHWEGAIARSFGKESAKEFVKNVAKTLTYSVAGEANEEALTSVVQDLTDYATGANPDALTGIFGRAADAGIIGGLSGGGMTAPVAVGDGVARSNNIREANLARDFYNNLGASIENTKLATRSKEHTSMLINNITEGGPVENVYIPSNAFEVYFQEKGVPPAAIAQELGIAEEYAAAKASGADIKITLAQWTEKIIGTEHWKGMQNDIKFDPMGLTINELKAEAAEAVVTEQAAVQDSRASDESAKVIQKNVKRQLMATGMKEKDARMSAMLHAQMFKTFAEKAGTSPEELFNRYDLKINNAEEVVNQDGTAYNQAEVSPLGFYSQVESEIDKMDFKSIPPKELLNRVTNIQGLKQDELETLGIKEWLGEQTEKVTKEQVMEFIRSNMVKLDQKILGGTSGAASEGFDFSDQEFNRLSGYYRSEAINNELENQDSDYIEERKAEIREQLVAEYTDENGEIDEDGLSSAVDQKYDDDAYKAAEEYVDSEDYFGAQYTITERNSGYKLIGNDDNGWYSSDLNEWFHDDIEEAKIKFAQKLIEEGVIEGDQTSIVTADNIQFGRPKGKSVSEETIKKKSKELAKTDHARLMKQAVEEYGEMYSDYTEEKRQKELEDDVLRYARDEVRESYNDPSNAKNQITIPIKTSLVDGDIVGNNVKGYTFTLRKKAGKGAKSVNEFELQAKTPDDAIAEAKQIMVDKKVIGPARSKDPADINKPTGPSKFSRYQVEGGENYRELLITLPENEGNKFYYKNHFDDANILAHVRMTDRVDEQGRKVLFAEEIQSDWHQQGRERGYADSSVKDKIKEIESEIDSIETMNFAQWMTEKNPEITKKEIDAQFNNEESAEFKEWRKENGEAFDRKSKLNEERQSLKAAVPDAPFKNTEAWSAIALKRLLNIAVAQGFEAIAWTPASVHVDRWGTDSVSWVKKDDHWLVGSVEQVGGNADGVNVEELARQRGELLERRGEKVETKEQLREVIADTLNRERTDRSLESLTDNVWDQMQAKESGVKAPRKEGMEFYYDNVLPKKVAPQVLKKIDKSAKVSVGTFDTDGETLKAWEIVITPEMKAKIGEGQTLFQNNDELRGQIRFGKDRKFNIDLFKSKDQSTFLHETGHFIFEVMGDLAQDASTSQSLKDDYQSILSWVGVESRDQIETKHHEQIARAFEAYLMEGKAPSSALRKAFNTFKTWLTNIYKQAKNLNVELSDEIRQVFDRILVAESETRAAEQAMSFDPLFADPTAMGMSADQAVKYIEAREEARQFSESVIREKLMNDLTRKQTQEYKDKREALVTEITTEANGMRVYNAISMLTKGTYADGTDRPGTAIKPTLSRESIEAVHGKEFTKTLPRGIFQPEGMPYEITAQSFGYQSGEDFLNALAMTIPKKDYIENQVNAEMLQRYPELLTSPEVPQEAIDAVHNEKREKFLRMEMEYLSKFNPAVTKDAIRRVARRVPSQKEVREQAREIIASKKISDLKGSKDTNGNKPGLKLVYKRAEIKAAKEAGQLLAKGDIDGAFAAKRRELMNHELYRAATEARDMVDKNKEKWKRIFKTDEKLAKSRDMDIVNAARAVLAKYGLEQSDKTAEEYLSNLKKYDPDAYAGIITLVNSANNGSDDFTNISFEKFLDLSDSIEALWDLSKSSKEIQLGEQKMQLDDLVQKIAEKVQEKTTGKDVPGRTRDLTEQEKLGVDLLGLSNAYRKVEHWAYAFDGGDHTGIMSQLVKKMIDAQTDYQNQRIELHKKLEELSKNLDADTKTRITAEEIGFTFDSKQQLLHAILHTGNESNMRKLLVGRGWGALLEDNTLDTTNWDRMVNRLQKTNVLTKQDYDFVQSVWDLNEELKPAAQRAHKKIYGYHFSDITANEFTTAFGKYRGGYVPAIVDQYLNQDGQIHRDIEGLENFNAGNMMPTTGNGFTKSRVESYAAPLVLDLRKITSHMEKVLRFSTIEPNVRDVARVFNNKTVRDELFLYDQELVSQLIIPWLKRTAMQVKSQPVEGKGWNRLSRVASTVRSNAALQIMSLNVANWFQNFTGSFPVLTRVEAKHFAGAMKDYLKAPGQTSNSIQEKSPYMKGRINSNVRDISENYTSIVMAETKFEKFKDAAVEFGYIGEKVSNAVVEMVAWNGAYRQAFQAGKTDKEAVDFADHTVRQTLGDNSAAGASGLDSVNPFAKLFTMFSGYFYNLGNLMTSEMQIAKSLGFTSKAGGARAAKAYTMIVMVPSIVSALIMRAFSGKGLDEDDDGEYLDDAFDILFLSQFRFVAAMAPFGIGQVINTGLNKYMNNKPYDDKINVSPVISAVERVMDTPKDIYNAATKGASASKALNDALTTVGLVTGLPFAAAGRPLGYLADVSQGKAKPKNPVDFTRGLLTGKKGN